MTSGSSTALERSYDDFGVRVRRQIAVNGAQPDNDTIAEIVEALRESELPFDVAVRNELVARNVLTAI